MAKQAYEDYKRHISDDIVNNNTVKVLEDKEFVNTKSHMLKVI